MFRQRAYSWSSQAHSVVRRRTSSTASDELKQSAERELNGWDLNKALLVGVVLSIPSAAIYGIAKYISLSNKITELQAELRNKQSHAASELKRVEAAHKANLELLQTELRAAKAEASIAVNEQFMKYGFSKEYESYRARRSANQVKLHKTYQSNIA
jgi:hypothetical protein